MTQNVRLEGTLASLREEWTVAEARLRMIEDAIRAVTAVLEATPGEAPEAQAVTGGSARRDPELNTTTTGQTTVAGGAAKPPLKASILRLLRAQPGMWPIDALVTAMQEHQLVGGATAKARRETIRQAANRMAADGEIRRAGSDYGWPPGLAQWTAINRRFRSEMRRLTPFLDNLDPVVLGDPTLGEQGS
jgi:hypothetical protein